MRDDGRLDGRESRTLANLLSNAFLPQRFTQFLFYRLDKHTHNYASQNDDYPTVLFKVVQAANAGLWWRDLLREARNAVPADPGLVAFAEQLGHAPTVVTPSDAGMVPLHDTRQLQLKIRAAQSTFNIVTWRKRVGEIEGQVCRIEYPEMVDRGTGFLVGPDVVLTNYHVVEAIDKGNVEPAKVTLRFDYKVLADGVEVSKGTTYRLAQDWKIDMSPYSQQDFEVSPSADPNPDELDYALLRVEGTPGEDPVGGETDDPETALRGWVAVPAEAHNFAAQRALYIVQHPDGDPMQIALDTEAVLGLNGNKTRVRYTTTTEPGSSGSPCFGPDWQWVALHQSGDPKYWRGERPEFNQGIPLQAIREHLSSRPGLEQVLDGGA